MKSDFQPDCYALTHRGIPMPARWVRLDGEGRSVVAAPSGQEYTLDGESILSVEEAEKRLRESRVEHVRSTYTFSVMHQGATYQIVRCVNPEHPKRSNYIMQVSAGRSLCSCSAHQKDRSQPCKHLSAWSLKQQEEPAPATQSYRTYTKEEW